ncbi:MAG: hypothetical protein AABM30_12700 [Actinomycetota bacterium]
MRAAAFLGVCAAAAVLVLGFTILGGKPSRAGKPALQVIRWTPLTVRGERFHSRERVRLTAGTASARAGANGDGVFVVSIPGVSRCDTGRVLARGSAGSYVVLKMLPLPACLPARSS